MTALKRDCLQPIRDFFAKLPCKLLRFDIVLKAYAKLEKARRIGRISIDGETSAEERIIHLFPPIQTCAFGRAVASTHLVLSLPGKACLPSQARRLVLGPLWDALRGHRCFLYQASLELSSCWSTQHPISCLMEGAQESPAHRQLRDEKNWLASLCETLFERGVDFLLCQC
jgi:hypothetical protein